MKYFFGFCGKSTYEVYNLLQYRFPKKKFKINKYNKYVICTYDKVKDFEDVDILCVVGPFIKLKEINNLKILDAEGDSFINYKIINYDINDLKLKNVKLKKCYRESVKISKSNPIRFLINKNKNSLLTKLNDFLYSIQSIKSRDNFKKNIIDYLFGEIEFDTYLNRVKRSIPRKNKNIYEDLQEFLLSDLGQVYRKAFISNRKNKNIDSFEYLYIKKLRNRLKLEKEKGK